MLLPQIVHVANLALVAATQWVIAILYALHTLVAHVMTRPNHETGSYVMITVKVHAMPLSPAAGCKLLLQT